MQKKSLRVFIASAVAVFIIVKCSHDDPAENLTNLDENSASSRYAEIKKARQARLADKENLETSLQNLNDLGINDKALLQCIKNTVETALSHSGESPISSATEIKKLHCRSGNIQHLDGLEHFTKLQDIDLSYNKIQNLTPLQPLTQVKTLNLMHNEIASIWPILGMDLLEELKLTDNPVRDLNYIGGLDSLKQLKFRLTSKHRCDYLVGIKRAAESLKLKLGIPSRCLDEFGEAARISDFE